MIDSRVKKGKAQVEKETRVLGRYELVEAVMETRTGPRPSIISFLMVHQLSIGELQTSHNHVSQRQPTSCISYVP